jgi:hypothetical protein
LVLQSDERLGAHHGAGLAAGVGVAFARSWSRCGAY